LAKSELKEKFVKEYDSGKWDGKGRGHLNSARRFLLRGKNYPLRRREGRASRSSMGVTPAHSKSDKTRMKTGQSFCLGREANNIREYGER